MKLLVVIPTHARPANLRRALASVAGQRSAPDRVVVVGQTEADVRDAAFAQASAEVRLSTRSPGPSGSHNTALIDAHEDAVAFLDDDDWWEPDHLERVRAALAQADVAYSGLVRHEEGGPVPQPIPASLAIEDFLAGNPGVQASNLALRTETFWRAGGFDEWLPASIDRDLLIRVLELPSVRVARIEAYTVQYLAYGHLRLSDPRSPPRLLGLQRFEAKHRHRMSPAVLARSRARALALFGWDGTAPGPSSPEHESGPARADQTGPSRATRRSEQLLAVGFSASSLAGARRTLAGLEWLAATGARVQQVVLVDDTEDSAQLAQLVASHPLAVTLLSASDVNARAARGVYGVAHVRPETRRGIAFGRTVVHHELYARMAAGACAWVLDDDYDLRDLRWEGAPIDGAGMMGTVAVLSAVADVAVGGIHGDPPLRPGAGVRTALVDLLHAAQGGRGIARDGADLYHDLSSLRTDHLETPLSLSCSLAAAARALAAGRPGLRQATARAPYGDPPTRGGNTLVFAAAALREYPNAAPWFGTGLARRADSLWLLALRDLGQRGKPHRPWRIRSAPLSAAQRRLVDNRPSVADLELDIDGWALLRALERVGWRREAEAAWLAQLERAFVRLRRERLSALRASALRVQSLCDVLAAHHPALAALAQVERLRGEFDASHVDALSRREGERVVEALRFVRAYPELARSYRSALLERPELTGGAVARGRPEAVAGFATGVPPGVLKRSESA